MIDCALFFISPCNALNLLSKRFLYIQPYQHLAILLSTQFDFIIFRPCGIEFIGQLADDLSLYIW